MPDSLLAGPILRAGAQSPASRVRLEGALGLNHYAGEGGDYAGGLADDVFDNAGAGLQLGLAYEVRRPFALGFVYEAGRYPTLPDPSDTTGSVIPPPPPPPGGGFPTDDPLDDVGSGSWLHQASVVVRATLAPWVVTPYALAGVTAAVGSLGGTFRAGVGPRVGIGAEGAVGRRVAVFAEVQGTLAFPAFAEDAAGGRGSSPLSSFRVGVRYSLAGGRFNPRVGAAAAAGEDRTADEPSSTPPDPPPPADGGN
jgi:hypothetical protein